MTSKRSPRLYSLFEKRPDGTWFRASNDAFTKPLAVRIFQNKLLEPYLGTASVGIRELRPIPKK